MGWTYPLSSLVLPTGSTTGARIVLNGLTDEIDIFDAGNNLVGQINPSNMAIGTALQTAFTSKIAISPVYSNASFSGAALLGEPPTIHGDTFTPGAIFFSTDDNTGLAGGVQATTQIQSPTDTNDVFNQFFASISLAGRSHDGTIASSIYLNASRVLVGGPVFDVNNQAPTSMLFVPAAGWANLAGGTPTEYYIVPSPPNTVFVYGSMTPGTKVDGTHVMSFAPGFQPAHAFDLPLTVNSMAGATAQSPHLNIQSDGTAYCYGCANATLVGMSGFIPLGR